jgi:hypothetical protein
LHTRQLDSHERVPDLPISAPGVVRPPQDLPQLVEREGQRPILGHTAPLLQKLQHRQVDVLVDDPGDRPLSGDLEAARQLLFDDALKSRAGIARVVADERIATYLTNPSVAAERRIEAGGYCPAGAQLRAFGTQVETRVYERVLTQGEADPLIAGVTRILNGPSADSESAGDEEPFEVPEGFPNLVTVERPSAGAGNALFRLGDDLVVRLPLHLGSAAAVAMELTWLPWLASQLPLAVPIPVAAGADRRGPASSSEMRATTSATPATAKRVLSAKELVAMVPWSYNLDEDAVIAMLPELRASLVRNAAEVLDDVYINADTAATGNINHDSATLTVNEAGKAQYLLGWNGLARIPLVDNTGQQVNQAAAPNAAMFNNARAKLGKYGVLPSQVVHVMNIETWIKSQTVEQLRTLDKFGPQATILTGQLGAVEGIPAIVSEQLKLAPAGGKVHATTGNTTGRMLTFNRTQYTRGTVRGLLIETERDIQKRQTVMVASMRISFIGRVAASGDTAVSIVRNITV